VLAVRSPKWPALRRAWIRDNPLCAACGTALHVEVHHLIPVHVAPDGELLECNLLSLCDGPTRSCHFYIGHACNFKGYNLHCIEDAARFLLRVQESSRLAKQRPL
jgi:hypothetical protein